MQGPPYSSSPSSRPFPRLASRTTIHIAAGLVLLTAFAPRLEAAEGPRAVFDELIHDFGTVTRADVAEYTFVVTNRGDEPLEIRGVTTTCACTVVKHPQTVLPGETGELKVALDTDLVNGPLQAKASVYTNDPNDPKIDLTLKIETQPFVYVTPGYIRYDVYQNFPGEGAVHQRMWADKPKEFKVTRVESPYEFLEVTAEELPVDQRDPKHDGPQWVIKSKLSPQAPVGPLVGYVRVFTDHEKQKKVSLPLSGFVRPVFALTPATLDLKTFDLTDAALRASVHIKQFSEGLIEITSIDTDIVGLETAIEPITDGREYWLYITVPPTMPRGAFAGTVRLHTSSDLARVVEVPVSGTVR